MTGHLTPLGSSTHTTVARGVLPVGFSKYDNSSFKLRTGPLPPGEYAVSCVRRQTAFCFGVDPQKIRAPVVRPTGAHYIPKRLPLFLYSTEVPA